MRIKCDPSRQGNVAFHQCQNDDYDNDMRCDRIREVNDDDDDNVVVVVVNNNYNQSQ